MGVFQIESLENGQRFRSRRPLGSRPKPLALPVEPPLLLVEEVLDEEVLVEEVLVELELDEAELDEAELDEPPIPHVACT
jgi:hypothetical protein